MKETLPAETLGEPQDKTAGAVVLRLVACPGPTLLERRVDIVGSGLTLSRSDQAGLTIHDDRLSRLHVHLERRGAGLRVRDLGSRNGI